MHTKWLVPVLGLVLFTGGRASADDKPRFRFTELLQDRGDVYLWPINLHLGYANTSNANEARGGFALGADVATFTYEALVVDTATMRAALRSSGGDFFLGARALGAVYPGRDLTHQLALGSGFGWGSVGANLDEHHDGHLIVAPAFRYMVAGIFGVEVAAHLPVARGGDTYPTLWTVNLMGAGGLLILGAATR